MNIVKCMICEDLGSVIECRKRSFYIHTELYQWDEHELEYMNLKNTGCLEKFW